MSSMVKKSQSAVGSRLSESQQSSKISYKSKGKSKFEKEVSQIENRQSFQSSKKSSSEGSEHRSSAMKKKENHKISQKNGDEEEKYVRIEEYEVEEERVPIGTSKKTSKITQNRQYSKISQAKSKKSINSYRQKSQLNKISQPGKLTQKNSCNPSPSVLQQLNQSRFIQSSSSHTEKNPKTQIEVRYSKLSSRIQASQNNKMVEQEYLQSYLKDHLDQDIIQGPELNPQTHSFHLNNSKSIDCIREPTYSFRQALQIKYQGVDAHHKEIGLFTKQPFFKNVLKNPRNQSKTSKRSFFDPVLSKRSVDSQSKSTSQWQEKQQFSSQSILKESTSKESELLQMQEKLRELEKEKMAMQMKLVIKETQIRSLKSSSVYGSQKNLQFYNTPTDSRFWPKEETSLHASLAKRKVEGQFEKEIEPAYRQYLDSVQGSTFRKNLIRTKSLAYNSEELEIGCLSQLLSPKGQNDGTLDIVLYITFHQFQADNFTISMIHDSSFQSSLTSLKIDHLKTQKQYKIIGRLKAMRIPFHFPEVEITYRTNNEVIPRYLRVFLPLSFNKFVQIQPFTNNSTSDMKHLRTNDFKINSKNMPLEKIAELLTGWTMLSAPSTKRELILGATCNFKDNKFNVILNLSQRNSWIQAWLVEGDSKFVQFFACTMKDIFCLKKK